MRHSFVRITLIAAVLAVIGVAAPADALFPGTLPVNKCVAGKAKCVGKLKTCLLNCHRKALGKGLAVDAGCLDKCRDKFNLDPAVAGKGCFAKLEAKGGCGASVGDAATFAAKTEAHVTEALQQLVPGGGNPLNKCTAGKVGCLRKYNSCVLKAVAKAAQKGTAIDVSKCLSSLSFNANSCVDKLESKYCDDDPSCASPACLTFGDARELRLQDDFFVDDAIAALETGPADMNTQRCTGDTSVPCASAPGGVAGCGGPLGTCEFYFSAPLSYSAGGIGVCVTRRWNGSISGTFDQATGASAGSAAALSTIYNGIDVATPCPRCVGDAFPNDGASDGTCSGGALNGMACDGNGQSPEPSFGVTSLDCPPTGEIASLTFDLSNSTGTIAPALTVASPTCSGAPGKLCLCASCSLNSAIPCQSNTDCALASAGTCNNLAGEPRKPNSCIDDTTQGGDGTICSPTAGGAGVCSEGPIVQHCKIETFRGCISPVDCPLEGDSCVENLRPCFAGYNGAVGDTITATGRAADGRNGAATMGFGSVFCYAPTPSNAVNAISGFPGPGRLQLAGVGADDGGPGCPTEASFLPTSASGVLDAGWTGLTHGYRAVGQGKVTVATSCTGTYPNCACSYTGPIANPDAP